MSRPHRAAGRWARTGRSRGWPLLAALVAMAVARALPAAEVYQTPPNHRLAKTINCEWTFNYFPSENADSNGCAAATFDDSTWPVIAVPHTWLTYETTGKLHPFIHDAHEKDDPYWWRGWGWYRKHFSISPEEAGRRIYVEFDAVQKYCKVFVNGKFVGDHKGGYDGFYFDITDLVRFGADNVLAVAVNCDQDDRFKIPPMSAGNWNTYGGIYRDVRLVIKDPLHIPFQGSYQHEGGTFVTTPQVSETAGTVEVKTWVRNDYATAKSCELRTTIADAVSNVLQVLTAQKIIQPGELAEFDQTSAPVANPHLWSPETPYVYHVFSDVYADGAAADHFESPFGFRWFKWDYANNRLILNGKKVIIHGTNHHQEWPWLGDATPKWLLLDDLRDIRENLNDNFMRTAHYPNDPAIYDFNDHHGIITIEELPNDKRQKFSKEVQVQQLRETIRRDRNHPSIFFWSMGNETDDAVDSKYAVAEDTTRLIHARDIYDDYQSAGKFLNTTSSNLALESLLRCTIRGWYNADVRDLEPKSVQQAGNEEWQHDQAAAAFIKLNRGRAADDLANLNTWIYEDHGCDRRYVNCPLDFVNPKGWVDVWREPKYMYYLWQAWYLPRPMVYIHPYVWSRRYLGAKKEVVVDSNCQTVELLVNGRSVGVLHPSLAEANVVRFENVPVEEGVLTAIGTRGTQTVTNQVVMAGPPARLQLSFLTKDQPATPRDNEFGFQPAGSSTGVPGLPAACDSLAVVRADIVDASGVHVFGATNTLFWSVSGPATLVGAPVYNSDINQNEAGAGTMYIDAPAFNLVRSTGKSGIIEVRVHSPGLIPATVTLLATNAPETGPLAIREPPLPDGNRLPVARENRPAPPPETVQQKLRGVSEDLTFKAEDPEEYARAIDDFLREKNPDLDFNSPEYRAVIPVFARLAQDNHGRIVRDDFDFIVGCYNNCRQITQQIEALNLPAPLKQSLREKYAREMIENGEAKNYDVEIRQLKQMAHDDDAIQAGNDNPSPTQTYTQSAPLARDAQGTAMGKPTDGDPLDVSTVEKLRREIRENFFVPDPLPALDAKVYRAFSPAPGVRAEAVSYTTEFGVRVPAILYLPDPLPREKIPAFVVVNGHGGDKYCWYSFYTGVLFARGGAAVLTYDQIGEGERNIDHKSGTRAHDHIKGGPVIARYLAGLMICDAMQAVSYLRTRPEVDARRIAIGGYSLGSFVVALTGAIDPRIRACVLCGGGDLDGPGGYWDSSDKKMCQAFPYQSLDFLGDRPAVIYALHAARGPTLVFNGLGDDVVDIPHHGETFFEALRERTIQLHGSATNVFAFGFAPTNCGHRPYWLTKPVVEWLERQIDFPNWTAAQIAALPEIRIGNWAATNHVPMDKLYATELREAGTPALDDGVPGYSRDNLDALPLGEWAAQKTNFILETWLAAAEQRAANSLRPAESPKVGRTHLP